MGFKELRVLEPGNDFDVSRKPTCRPAESKEPGMARRQG